ncbi:MAG: hypothetical protein RH917_09135 [Lacipirellulaceae bacterium]
MPAVIVCGECLPRGCTRGRDIVELCELAARGESTKTRQNRIIVGRIATISPEIETDTVEGHLEPGDWLYGIRQEILGSDRGRQRICIETADVEFVTGVGCRNAIGPGTTWANTQAEIESTDQRQARIKG